ncbi:MAG: hypothetical protein ACFFDO_09840 [Candidatus Thorarchaeota archaeon]
MALKGILWSLAFFLTAIIFIAIPSYLVFEYWTLLNILVDPEGRPIYTFALFAIFLYIVSLLVALIYLVAGVRAIVQCRNKEGLGIPEGVKGFGLVVDIIIVSFFVVWYFLFGQIPIFTWGSPYG